MRIAVAAVLLAIAAGVVAWRLADVKPDPNQQAVADGCQRNTTRIYTGFAPNWVYVNDKDYPASGPPPAPRWADGIVASQELPALASRISSSDDPITHRSFDVNVDVAVAASEDYLTGTSRDSTPEAGTIHTERESGAFPLWAMPAPGDHVSMLGAWVWDCDHYQEVGEKTELHPFYGLWSLRRAGRPSPNSRTGEAELDAFFSTDGTPAAAQAECAHLTKGADTFKDCTHSRNESVSLNGDYAHMLCAPGKRPEGAKLEWHVVDRGDVGDPTVAVTPGGPGCVKVAFTVEAVDKRIVVAEQVFAGWSKPRAVEHLRLHFDKVLIRRAMDPSTPNESTLTGQIASAPGEWQLTWSVDGIWGRWPGTLLANDGSVFKGRQHVDFYVARGTPWTLVMEGRECDFGAIPDFDGPGHAIAPCPKTNEVGNSSGDDYGGSLVARFRSPDASLGTHSTNATTAGSSCPPSNVHGCYQLTYTVSRVR